MKNRVSLVIVTSLIWCTETNDAQSHTSQGIHGIKDLMAATERKEGTAIIKSESGTIRLESSSDGLIVLNLSGIFENSGIFRNKDIIKHVDGKEVKTPESFLGYVRDNPKKKIFKITICRNAKSIVKSAESDFIKSFMTPKPPDPPMPPAN